jgi:hypothetical protein
MINRILYNIAVIAFISLNTQAQQLSVLSFKLLENDLEALSNPLSDPSSGQKAALLKIVTTQTDQLGIVKGPIYKTAEIWLYLPVGARKMNISHPQMGMLREYIYPITIEAQKVYEMILDIPLQTLTITAKPENANITINKGLYEALGEFQKKLKLGNYSYKVEAPYYTTETGTIELTLAHQVNKTINLKPNFGIALIRTTPTDGVKIIIDDYETPLVAPYITEKLKPGQHTVKVMKDKYKGKVQYFTIDTGKTTNVDIVLQPKKTIQFSRIAMWGFIGASGYLFFNSYNQFNLANADYDKYKTATSEATNLHNSVLTHDKYAIIYAASGAVTSVVAVLLKIRTNKINLSANSSIKTQTIQLTYNF